MGGYLRHSSRVSLGKAATPPKQIYRLVDMEVEEVSLVDRPANKRKFLVVKKEIDQMATEVTSDGKGGFTASTGTAKGKDKEDKEAAKKAALEVPPGFKEMVAPILTKAAERLQALVDLVGKSKAADVPDDGSLPGVPGEFATELASVVGLLEKVGGMWPTAAPELDDAEEAPPADAPAPTDMQLRAAEKALVKGAALMKRADVQKIGAKMSKDRYTRLQQAAQVLTNLISELAPAATPSGELGKSKDKDDKEAAKKGEAPPAWAASLAQSVASLANVVKSTQTDIATIKKARGLGASTSPEVTPEVKKDDGQDFSWPLDMNNPIRRDGVNKSESFFDVDE